MAVRAVRSNEKKNFLSDKYPGLSGQQPCQFRWRVELAIPCFALLLITGCAWPTYRQNQYRTGRSTIDTSSDVGTLMWSHIIGQGPLFSSAGPVVGVTSSTLGGIYVGDLAGNLYSFTPGGTVAWTISLPVTSGASPNAIGLDGTIYVADTYGSLYAVSSSGTLNWTFTPPGGLSSAEVATYTDCTAAAGCETTIYTGNDCGVFYALNSGGSVKWTFGTFQRDCSLITPTISPAISADGTIYSGVAYPAQRTGILFALNSSGNLLWSSNVYAGTPAIDPSTGIIYVVSVDGFHLFALNSAGVLQWQLDAPHPLTLPAIASDGTIYLGTFGSGLWAVNPNGTIKWQTSPGGQSEFDSAPIIGGDGTIYIARELLYAINPDSTTKWGTWTCGGAGAGLGSNEPVIATGGMIYLVGGVGLNGGGFCPLEAFQ